MYFSLIVHFFLSKRQKIHVPALRVWATDIPHPQEEVRSLLLLNDILTCFYFAVPGLSLGADLPPERQEQLA
jgi:hypothetical protein